MKLIQVHVECYQADDNIPAALRDDIESETEYREGYVDAEKISCFYALSKGSAICFSGQKGDNIFVQESVKQINQLIIHAIKI